MLHIKRWHIYPSFHPSTHSSTCFSFLNALQSKLQREFPGCPVVRIPVFPLQGAQVQSLFKEIRSPKTQGIAKKKKWRPQYTSSLNTSACTSLIFVWEPNICLRFYFGKMYVKWNVQILHVQLMSFISWFHSVIFGVVCYQSTTQPILDDSFHFMLWCHSLVSLNLSFSLLHTQPGVGGLGGGDGQGGLQYSDVVTKWDSAHRRQSASRDWEL